MNQSKLNYIIPGCIIICFLIFSCGQQAKEESTSEKTEATDEPVASELDEPSPWKNLFEGNSLAQWKGYLEEDVPEKGWNFDGDTLKLQRAEGEGRAGDIITRENYEDFELKFEFLLSEGANGGIFWRVVEREGDLIYYNAPEFQLLDNHSYLATTDLESLHTHLTGDCYDLYTSGENLLNPPGEWNTGQLISKKGQVEHWINGKKAVSYTIDSDEWNLKIAGSKFNEYAGFAMSKEGPIGLQDHGSELWFRNMMIRTF